MCLDAVQVHRWLYQSCWQRWEKRSTDEPDSVPLLELGMLGEPWPSPVCTRLGPILSLLLLDCDYTNTNFCPAAAKLCGDGPAEGTGNVSRPGNRTASDRRSESFAQSVAAKEAAEMLGERQMNRSPCPREQEQAANVPPALFQRDCKRVGCSWRREDAIIMSFKQIVFSSPSSFGAGKVILTSQTQKISKCFLGTS